MNNDLAVVAAAYEMLRKEGLVHSKAEFSQQWLMRGESYLSSAQARDRRPSRQVLEQLASRLRTTLTGLQMIGPIHTEILRRRAVTFGDASAVVEMHLLTY